MYAFVHFHAFVKYLLPVPVNHRNPRNTHPTRCVNHLTIQRRNVKPSTRFGRVWGTGMGERVSLVQIHRVEFVKDVRATNATIL